MSENYAFIEPNSPLIITSFPNSSFAALFTAFLLVSLYYFPGKCQYPLNGLIDLFVSKILFTPKINKSTHEKVKNLNFL